MIAVAAVLALTAAQAQSDSKWYGIAGLGTASVQSDLSDMSASSGTLTATQTIDTTGNVFFGGVGYQFDDLLAFEAQYIDIRGFNANQTVTANNAVVNGTTINGTFSANQDIKATALALTKHPKINSYWMEDRIRVNKHVHIGMAVAVEDGLLVPVIRFANEKSIAQISSEAKELGGKAKSKQLQPKDWEGNTFTVSNLGMFGIDQFTSIINSPESCILAVGGIKETVGVKNGQFYATNIMKLTLTCDHRVADGAAGAAFLLTLKQYLEDPLKMFL